MADRQPVRNHARCLLVNRIHLEQEEDKEGDGGREEGEQGPDHGLDRAKVGDGDYGLAGDGVGGRNKAREAQEHRDQGAGNGRAKLLGHGAGRKDKARGGGAVLGSGVVGDVGVHGPQQRGVEANADGSNNDIGHHHPDPGRVHGDEEEEDGRYGADDGRPGKGLLLGAHLLGEPGRQAAEDHTGGLTEHHKHRIVDDQPAHGDIPMQAVLHQVGRHRIAETVEKVGANADQRQDNPRLVAE